MDWEVAAIGVFIVVGLTEYVKGFHPKAGSIVWRLALVPSSLIVSASIEYLPRFVLVALLILACSQLGYEVVVETVRKRLGGKE